ncbi:hypothetical protein, partial [Enterocloster clostridioformis]|uniref:hypothetical protein n=1 Tax=Enterocloster clostridioformis TaxID=1531 RepID=UPI001F2924D5
LLEKEMPLKLYRLKAVVFTLGLENKKGPLSGPVRSETASGLHLTPISQKPSGQAGSDFPAVNRYS